MSAFVASLASASMLCALSKAALGVVVILLSLLLPLLSLLPWSLSLPLSSMLSLLSCYPPHPMLPPPPITLSTWSLQSSAATSLLSITIVIKSCHYCPPDLPLPSFIAAVKCQSLLLPVAATTVKPSLLMSPCCHHGTPANTDAMIKCPCSLPLLSITTATLNAQLLPSSISTIKCQWLLWRPATVKCWHCRAHGNNLNGYRGYSN